MRLCVGPRRMLVRVFQKSVKLILLHRNIQDRKFPRNKLARSGHTQDINEKGKRRGEEREGESE